MGGGGGPPIRPTRGRDPLPAAARATGPALRRGHPARPSPRRRRRRWKTGAPRGGRGRDGEESWVRVCFVLPSWLRAHPRGRTSWPGEPGPPRPRSGRPGAAPRCARRVPPRASARAQRLGLSFLLPPARPPARSPARSLPEPGLIWSRWRQGVGAAQPPLLGCQYSAHSPARLLARSHAHPRAAAARPGILSKFPALPARALGPRRLPRLQPHAPLVPRRKHYCPCLLESRGSGLAPYLPVKFRFQCLFPKCSSTLPPCPPNRNGNAECILTITFRASPFYCLIFLAPHLLSDLQAPEVARTQNWIT